MNERKKTRDPNIDGESIQVIDNHKMILKVDVVYQEAKMI